ncbi:MAG TPA: tetratricopeptide repeat protein, partial [Polyangia bacterium]
PTTPAVAAPTPTPAPREPAPAATPPPEPAPTEAAAAPTPPRPRHTLGGKKVVLEYDPKPTSPTPPPAQAPTPMGEDPATVARARESYHKGNVKLFAGDDEGAIALYRESLKIYPGYVAGYRGLGLAFEEAGKTDEALKAFHIYVRTVPNAVDASIIRRRIEHLESGKPAAK